MPLFPIHEGGRAELQWYLGFQLSKRTSMKICRESKTDCIYYTDKESGELIRAECPVPGERRRIGHFDIMCSGPGEKWIIELKYPRGKNQKEHYDVGLQRDLQKLCDVSDATRRYALCLIHSDYRKAYEEEVLKHSQKMLNNGIWHHIEVYEDTIA